MQSTFVPKDLQGVLWSRDISSVDLKKDKNYIIHQVLMYGTLEQIKWLEKVYTKKEIKSEFVRNPRKLYTRSAFNFIKNYILGINKSLPPAYYVKDLHRNIR